MEFDKDCHRRSILRGVIRVNGPGVLADVVEARERAAAVALERSFASMLAAEKRGIS